MIDQSQTSKLLRAKAELTIDYLKDGDLDFAAAAIQDLKQDCMTFKRRLVIDDINCAYRHIKNNDYVRAIATISNSLWKLEVFEEPKQPEFQAPIPEFNDGSNLDKSKLNVPTKVSEGSLDNKPESHPNFKSYDHSLEKLREFPIPPR